MLIPWQRAKTSRDEAESHLCKYQQQFFDQNLNTNTSWIPIFLADREKKHKHKNSNTLIKTHLVYCFDFDFDLIFHDVLRLAPSLLSREPNLLH